MNREQEQNFLNNVNTFLKLKGKGKKYLAEQCELSYSTIKRIFQRNRIKNVKFNTVYNIAKITGISIEVLLNKNIDYKTMEKLVYKYNL